MNAQCRLSRVQDRNSLVLGLASTFALATVDESADESLLLSQRLLRISSFIATRRRAIFGETLRAEALLAGFFVAPRSRIHADKTRERNYIVGIGGWSIPLSSGMLRRRLAISQHYGGLLDDSFGHRRFCCLKCRSCVPSPLLDFRPTRSGYST